MSPATASTVAENTTSSVSSAGNTITDAASKVPEFKDIVSQTLVDSISAVKSGAAWIQGQIPDILTQFLHWQLAKNVVTLVLWIIYGIVVYLVIKSKWIKAFDDVSEGFSTVVLGIAGGILTIYGVFHVIDAIMNIVQIAIAPKVYLLEYAASLVRNNS
jgi:hypothetical protein